MAVCDKINVAAMGYSVSSLHKVNRYLEFVREIEGQLPNQMFTNTVLATGCYVSEVIRRNGMTGYRWVNYADQFPQGPQYMTFFPEFLGTSVVVAGVDSRETVVPFNKVIKSIREGRKNSIYYSATRFTANTD